jgi:hypothetical protein
MVDRSTSNLPAVTAAAREKVIGKITVAKRQEAAMRIGFTVEKALTDCEDALKWAKTVAPTSVPAIMALRVKIAGFDISTVEIDIAVSINLVQALTDARNRLVQAHLAPPRVIDVEPSNVFDGADE